MGAVTVNVKEGWIGANSEQEARDRVQDRFPGCTIRKVYQKLSGMWAYIVEEQEDVAEVPFQDEPPEDDEPEEAESEV
jgi:hypothetical protein